MASKRRIRRLRGDITNLCPTKKRRYLTAAEAQFALVSARNKREREGQTGHVEQRIYSCPKCYGWHLTSMHLA
jgi:hypothetical protein